MLRNIAFIVYFSLISAVWGSPKDTLNYYRLKGIDVSGGGGTTFFGERGQVNFLKYVDEQAPYSNHYNYGKTIVNDRNISPYKIDLGFVFGHSKWDARNFIRKNELVFRFTFETLQTESYYNNIAIAYNPSVIESTRLNYTYQTQTIGLGYGMATRPIVKNVAAFAGVNADFGMVSFKRIEEVSKTHNSNYEIKNLNSTLIRGNVTFGIKYNFSCDINFFVVGELGMTQYGQGLDTKCTYNCFRLGIRYKFLDEQDRLNYKNTGFW